MGDNGVRGGATVGQADGALASGVGPGDAAWLASLLSDIGAAGIPARIRAVPAAPVTRRWNPSAAGETPGDGCQVIRRHPDLRFAFGGLPVFKVRKHRRGFGHGIRKEFSSSVTGRDVFAFSSLEFDALRLLELDGGVTDFIEQPVLLRYWLDGKSRLYRPDSLTLADGRLEIREVKFEADAVATEAKWRAIGGGLSAIGIGFEVITERHLRTEQLHRNVRTVFMARHARPDRARAETAVAALRASGPSTVGSLFRLHGLSFREACCLVRHGFLAADMHGAALGDGTVISASDRGRRDIWAARL